MTGITNAEKMYSQNNQKTRQLTNKKKQKLNLCGSRSSCVFSTDLQYQTACETINLLLLKTSMKYIAYKHTLMLLFFSCVCTKTPLSPNNTMPVSNCQSDYVEMRPYRMENSAKLNEKDVFDIRETILLRYVLQIVEWREKEKEREPPCRMGLKLDVDALSRSEERCGCVRDDFSYIYCCGLTYDAYQCLLRWM